MCRERGGRSVGPEPQRHGPFRARPLESERMCCNSSSAKNRTLRHQLEAVSSSLRFSWVYTMLATPVMTDDTNHTKLTNQIRPCSNKLSYFRYIDRYSTACEGTYRQETMDAGQVAGYGRVQYWQLKQSAPTRALAIGAVQRIDAASKNSPYNNGSRPGTR
jgi:hypothetical protein